MNFYEKPAELQFIDTYAALPFLEMFMVGLAHKQEYDKTQLSIDAYKAKYGDFSSMSQRDMANWDNEIQGKISPVLDKAAANAEYLKSLEGQLETMRAIRSVDTNKLNMYKLSAQNLAIRAEVIAKLKSQGKYKESWDNVDIANWDTSDPRMGIMSDLAPLEYTSLHDMAAPFTAALEPTYLGKKDRYHYWMGIDEPQIRNSINSQYDSVMSTPQGQAWRNDIAAELALSGVDIAKNPEKVDEAVIDRLVQSLKDYIHKKPVEDTIAWQLDLLTMKLRAALAKSAGGHVNLLDMIERDGINLFNRLQSVPSGVQIDLSKLTEARKKLLIAQTIGNPMDIAAAQAHVEQAVLSLPTSIESTIKNVYTDAMDKKDLSHINSSDLLKGTKAVVKLMSTPNPHLGFDAIIGSLNSAVVKAGGENQYIFSTTEGMLNPTTVVSKAPGLNVQKKENEFDNWLQGDVFSNLKVRPVSGNGVYNYTDSNGVIRLKLRLVVEVSEDDINFDNIRKDYRDPHTFDRTMRLSGATVKVIPAKETEGESESTAPGDNTPRVTTRSAKIGRDIKVYTFETMVDIPSNKDTGYGTQVQDINARYDKVRTGAKAYSDNYLPRVEDAFSFTLDDEE